MANFILSISEPRNKTRDDFLLICQVNFEHIFRFLQKNLFSKILADPKNDNNKISVSSKNVVETKTLLSFVIKIHPSNWS